MVSTVTTITDNAGQVIGVQGLDVSLESITNMIKDIKIEKTGYIILTDGDGTIIAHPKKPEMNGKEINELNNEKLTTALTMDSGDFETKIDGKDCYVNTYTSNETGWKFISIVEKSDLMEKFTGMAIKFVGLFVIIIILISIIAVVLSNKITKPITASAEFAQEIANGNLKVESIKIKENNENGVLIDSLNKMRDNLKEVIEGLYGSSADLTKSAKQLAEQSQQTSEGSSATAATVSEIAITIDQVATNVSQAANLSDQVSKEAEQGFKGVERITAQMDSISHSNNDATNVVEELAKTLTHVNKFVD
ncbi:hypothetical protein N752_08060 [Desulforamulus aquiferis]|nr:methyl-accepting chemotaxis protein [Desulforamulus aquiferis]RYD05838.1 hypothetical protein N752_08060 [Desulforamulus aquiferis]